MRYCKIFLGVIILSILVGCGSSGKLSEKEASSLIKGKYHVMVRLKFNPFKDTFSFWSPKAPDCWKTGIYPKKEITQALEKGGYIVTRKDIPYYRSYVWSVSLTKKAKKEGIKAKKFDNNKQPFEFEAKVCDMVLVEVTGIKTNKTEGTAIVKYTWKYGNLTPIGKILISCVSDSHACKKIHKNSAYFALYDDGWRINNMGYPLR